MWFLPFGEFCEDVLLRAGELRGAGNESFVSSFQALQSVVGGWSGVGFWVHRFTFRL